MIPTRPCRAASQALRLAFAIGLVAAACLSPATAQTVPDDQLFAAYKRACSEVRKGTFEERTLVCGALSSDEALVQKFIQVEARQVCGNIDRECSAADADARARLMHFASMLSCPAGTSVCTKNAPRQAGNQCTNQFAAAANREVFTCPVAGGGIVRGPDQCAQEGGRFNSRRCPGTNVSQCHAHGALDINSPAGTAVKATKAGKVACVADWDPDRKGKQMGKVVIIDHEDGDYSVYGHLASFAVQTGQCVVAGQEIGAVGYTGNAQCLQQKGLIAHLHFAVIRAGNIGLATCSGPIAAALKNADDWVEISKEVFGNDTLDVGIKDPEVLLKRTPACLR